MKETIKLRKKPMKNGGWSLYLDIYHKGVRKYEFLHLYLEPDTKQNKTKNKNTMELAEAILAKRIVEVRNSRYGFTSHERETSDFYQYLRNTAKASQKHGTSTVRMAKQLEDKLKLFCKRDTLPFSMIDKTFIVKFLDFMKSPKAFAKDYGKERCLCENSVLRYYVVLKATLSRAVRDEIIGSNPMDKIPLEIIPKVSKVEKVYLTENELQRMYDTECRSAIRRMFLFACATGLRYSDVVTMEWRDITERDNGRMVLRKKQVKTGNEVEVPLSKTALEQLPPRRKGYNGIIFPHPTFGGSFGRQLKKWAKSAGIEKNISFHTSRHTFATIALKKGVPLHVVSKLLGHASIKQTEIYAKVVDESKVEAIDMMPYFD